MGKELIIPESERFQIELKNDDTTQYEFVIYILENIFNMDFEQAEYIALQVHIKHSYKFGDYIKEIAETKVIESRLIALDNGFRDFNINYIKKD